jgi:hypothetical protein
MVEAGAVETPSVAIWIEKKRVVVEVLALPRGARTDERSMQVSEERSLD